jgi:hypothetical protein
MQPTTQDILREYRELFPDVSEKDILSEIENLKLFQASYTPSAQYTQDLKTRLRHLHDIEHTTKKTTVFSWLQYIGILTSFALIFGLAFSLYDIQKNGFSPVGVEEDSHEYMEIQSLG